MKREREGRKRENDFERDCFSGVKEIDFLSSFFDCEVNEREKENRLEEEQVEFYQFLTSLSSRTLLF